MSIDDERPFMTTAEVAALFKVGPKTVTEWARTGLIPFTRTPGGGRNGPLRFREEDVQALLDQGTTPASQPPQASSPGAPLTTPPGEDPNPHQEG